MMMFPGFTAGFVVIVRLVGDGPDKVDLDGGGGVVQDIDDDKRSC